MPVAKKQKNRKKITIQTEGYFDRFNNAKSCWILFGILVFFIMYLAIQGLGNAAFWDDEAQVAIYAKNYNKTGTFTGWDGRNLYAGRNGTLLNSNLQSINPKVDVWLCALSFKVFGTNTWAARFPFVISGITAIFIFALLIRIEFGYSFLLWGYLIGGFGLSSTFLLNIRQARYYSVALLSSLLVYLLYNLCIKTNKYIYFLLLSIASIVLFLSHFLIGTAFLVSMFFFTIIFKRSFLHKNNIILFLCSMLLFAAVIVPYAIKFKIWYRPDITASIPINFVLNKIKLIWWNFRDLNLLNCLPIPVIIIFAILVKNHYLKEKTSAQIMIQWICIGIFNTFFIAVFSPQITAGSIEMSDIRYLIVSVPFLMALTAFSIFLLTKKNVFIGITLFFVFLLCNIATLTPINKEFRWLLLDYIKEIHSEYPTPAGEVVKYLENVSRQDETIYAYPDYYNDPLMFYLGDKLIFCCTLDKQTPIPMETIQKLNSSLFVEDNFPDWFILNGYTKEAEDLLRFFSRPHQENGKNIKYQYKLESTLNVYFIQTQRPEYRAIGPVRIFNTQNEGVYVLRKYLESGSL